MRKYRKYAASRYDYPTSVNDGVLVIGHKRAREAVEKQIGRRLHEGTRVRKCGGNWVFCEPRGGEPVVPAPRAA